MRQTGAVILAAGLSSRMKMFKPLLPFKDSSIALHLVRQLTNLGVAPITVVTGFRGDELEKHLAGTGARFVRNHRFRESQMFDSVKLGIQETVGYCDRLLLMPMDIPAISDETFNRILKREEPLIRTMYSGKGGHPVVMSAELAAKMLEYQGEGGLKGAMMASGVPLVNLEVDDEAVCKDVDTREEYETLITWVEKRELTSQCNCDAEIHLKKAQIDIEPQCTEELCEKLWKQYGTSQTVRDHCIRVAEEAVVLGKALNRAGCELDLELLNEAARLHDFMRAYKNHDKVGAEILRKEGFPELADLVKEHHNLDKIRVDETTVLYLADKWIQGTKKVSLDERFSQSLGKCLGNESAMKAHEQRWQQARTVERLILARIEEG